MHKLLIYVRAVVPACFKYDSMYGWSRELALNACKHMRAHGAARAAPNPSICMVVVQACNIRELKHQPLLLLGRPSGT